MNGFYCYDDYGEEIFCDDCEEEEISYYEYEEEETPFDLEYSNGLLISETIRRKNGYTALASKYMLIADIDCGNKIEEPLTKLKKFVERENAVIRVYKTLNGMRYIRTDLMYHGVNRSAVNTLIELGSDPKYNTFCRVDGRYMARLTPKLDFAGMNNYYDAICDGRDTSVRVCNFIGVYCCGIPITANALVAAINKHDEACQVFETSLPLA